MPWASKTYTFSPSTTAASAEVNQNFDDAFTAINTAMPSGGIILWSGSIASIPSGWNLCNGSSSTPDLRDRFIVGAGTTYAVGNTGGATTINIQHSHTVNSHQHTGVDHLHYIDYYTYNDPSASDYDDTFEAGNEEDVSPAGSNHRHHITTYTQGADRSLTTGAASPGTNNALLTTQSILPPYYALAWIMKS